MRSDLRAMAGGVAIAAAVAIGIAVMAGAGLAQTLGPARPPQPSFRPATTELFRSGRPYIDETTALNKAASFALGAVTRQEAHILPYSVVSAYLQSNDRRMDAAREIYFVITSAPFRTRGGPMTAPVTCASFVTAIDATTGDVLTVGCEGLGAWPDRVPAGFASR